MRELALRAGIIHSEQEAQPERITIGQAIEEYLDFIKAHRKKRTHITYRYTLDTLLRRSYSKPFVDQVTREDILDFMTDCYKLGLGKRKVYDKLSSPSSFSNVMGRLSFCGQVIGRITSTQSGRSTKPRNWRRC